MDNARLLELYAHATWATGRVFDAASSVPADSLRAAEPGEPHSPLVLMAHLIATEQTWLARARG